MGGNALAKYGAKRVFKKEYEVLSKEVLTLLADFDPLLIPYYHEKESFGDMDVITRVLYIEDYTAILEKAGNPPYVRNGEVLSFLYNGSLQVDVIPTHEEDRLTSVNYYAYNDLGNLMGRIFHKMGLKYGHRGLLLPVKDGDQLLDEIVVSKDIESIFDFGGFNYKLFKEGFSSLEDIYRFVMFSRYFNSEIFQYANLNSVNRIRDRKRVNYHGFLVYLDNTFDHAFKPPLSYADVYSSNGAGYVFSVDKDMYIPLIFKHFPNVWDVYLLTLSKLENKRKIRLKYNGNIVSELTGLTGKSLGKFMSFLAVYWGFTEKGLITKTSEEIKEQIIEIYPKWVVTQE